MRKAVSLGIPLALVAAAGLASQAEPLQIRQADCGLEPPGLVPVLPPPDKGTPADLRFDGVPFIRQVNAQPAGGASTARFLEDARPPGTLTGKTVYLSAGHGFTWLSGTWLTQRGSPNEIVEDLVSAEAVDQYLAEYLRGMGAYVVTIRESDLNPERVIVDDTEAQASGGLVFAAGTDSGYGGLSGPTLADDTNPFATGTARRLTTSTTARGELTYVPTFTTSGLYTVYVSYRQAAGHAPDAHFVVRHAGGTSEFRVDQRRHGTTWVRLGRYYFDKDAPPEHAAVAILDDSATPGAIVSVDAVRFGGGMAVHDRGGGVSGRPQWEMAGRYACQLAGAPTTVWKQFTNDQQSDAASRPRFSAWDHEAGEDAIYLAWHTNAAGSPGGVGTESYTYSPNAPPASLSAFTGVPGSLELQAAVHNELIADIKALVDPNWRDRGKFTAYFAEVSPNHNGEIPATLVEIAFHDTPSQAAVLEQPRFRKIATRALAQGVARYFATKDGRALVLPPEPPIALSFRGHDDGTATLSWRPGVQDAGAGDAATAYRVYLSADGYAFDDGRAASGESFTVEGLSEGQTVFARVSATNAGGESLLGPVVGVRVPASGSGAVLVVDGFDSLEPSQLVRMDLSRYGLGTVRRMILHRMNDFSYVARHGAAVAAAGVPFDSATADALAEGDVVPSDYQAVDYYAGRQAGVAIQPAVREALSTYAAAGGRVLLSGSDLAARLAAGDEAEQAFLRDVLHAGLGADDAQAAQAAGGTGLFADLGVLDLADDGAFAFELIAPDALTALAGATQVLAYAGEVTGGAAVAFGDDAAGARSVLLGFPFETVEGADARADVMARVLTFLGVEVVDPPPPPPPPPPDEDKNIFESTCGCRVGGAERAPSAGLMLALGALVGAALWRRRRR